MKINVFLLLFLYRQMKYDEEEGERMMMTTTAAATAASFSRVVPLFVFRSTRLSEAMFHVTRRLVYLNPQRRSSLSEIN